MADKLTQQLILHEGLELKAYQCPSGRWTIGVGRNLQDRGITQQEAMYLLRHDIQQARRECRENLPFWGRLSKNRRDVLADMAMNLGIEELMKFKRTLAYIEDGFYEIAATHMLDSKWAGQVGNRAKRLAEMMRRNCAFDEAGI